MSDEIKDYTETVSVRLTKAQVARLRDYAKERGILQSAVIRQWISDCDVTPILSEPLKENLRQEEAFRRGMMGEGHWKAREWVEFQLKQWAYRLWGIQID